MLEIDDSEKPKLLHEETTSKIIGAAFEVEVNSAMDFSSEFISALCK
jgi:hypothetical protein